PTMHSKNCWLLKIMRHLLRHNTATTAALVAQVKSPTKHPADCNPKMPVHSTEAVGDCVLI
ncbi:unnamed protein product, partial [Ceratitis capitata]